MLCIQSWPPCVESAVTFLKYVEENATNLWKIYRRGILKSIGGVHGAATVYDEVAVSLEIGVYAVI